jgi:hypothetical protein
VDELSVTLPPTQNVALPVVTDKVGVVGIGLTVIVTDIVFVHEPIVPVTV